MGNKQTIAQAKIRKQRGRGVSNFDQGTDYSAILNSSAITHGRQQSHNGQGGINFMGGQDSGSNTAISGGRKPTADSFAYSVKPHGKSHIRGKFSNGGGSIGDEQESSYLNNSINLIEK